MTRSINRTGRLAIAVAVVGLAACGKGRDQALDPTLTADLQAASGGAANGAANDGLELAPSANKSQVVVSAIEGGPMSAPQHAAVKRTPRPTPKPAPRVAAARPPQPAPAPAPVETTPVEAPAPAPQRKVEAPMPAPASAPTQRQPGVYKTEGEIFQKMPWIKP